MHEIMQKLAEPFDPKTISWRVGPTNKEKTKGMALAYIDARDVMVRLDEVMGADWQDEYVSMANGSCCCRIGIKIDNEWRWRSNGALLISESDKADAKEMAEKGSYSDAFKRAAVLWGIGRYLYNLESPWMDIEPQGRSYVFTASALASLASRLGRKPHVPADIDEPRSTMQGRKTEAEGIRNARIWVNESLPYLRKELKTKAQLDKFQADNQKRIEWLKTALPDEFEVLDHALNLALERVNVLVAG